MVEGHNSVIYCDDQPFLAELQPLPDGQTWSDLIEGEKIEGTITLSFPPQTLEELYDFFAQFHTADLVNLDDFEECAFTSSFFTDLTQELIRRDDLGA